MAVVVLLSLSCHKESIKEKTRHSRLFILSDKIDIDLNLRNFAVYLYGYHLIPSAK
jgi:hypothetical protein